ncbi:MAG TPA: hypothetical protein VHO01_01760 [Jatrophihabitans sp.]|nr:hypothetical protein [Jatrophihabitans sp.]
MRIRTAAAIAAGLLALAGCASSSSGGSGGAGSAGGTGSATGTPVTPSGASTGPGMGGTASSPPSADALALAAAATCPTSTAVNPLFSPAAKPVPPGLPVVFVLRCRIVSSGGTPTTLVAERSTGDFSKLIAALQLPSVPRARVVCPLYAVQVPYFALIEKDGTSFLPKIPLDNCGKPQGAVLTALNQLQFTEITSKPIK